ncbi:MAG: hypothetical protein ACYDCC_10640 [Actinomycetota bacterium]
MKLFAAAITVSVLFFAPANAGSCTWHAGSSAQRYNAGPVEAGGGHGYGSGYHYSYDQSPPQQPGTYGDPKRLSGEGGYVEADLGGGTGFRVDAFSPLDETNNSKLYDTSGGACVSVAGTTVDPGEQYIPTAN